MKMLAVRNITFKVKDSNGIHIRVKTVEALTSEEADQVENSPGSSPRVTLQESAWDGRYCAASSPMRGSPDGFRRQEVAHSA